jgi:hypothetical protein
MNMNMNHELFKKAQEQDPHLTEEAFLAKRNEALNRASTEGHDFTEVNGVMMEGPITAEEREELNEDTQSMARS